LYGLTLDLGGATTVADMARQFGFVHPGSGKSVADLARGIPLFLARAGQDEFPGLNEALDRFLAAAVAENLPVRFVNHPRGPHAFDLLDDSETSREIIREVLRFLGFHLRAQAADGPLGPKEETR
jgi:acetyl esterase/lipase